MNIHQIFIEDLLLLVLVLYVGNTMANKTYPMLSLKRSYNIMGKLSLRQENNLAKQKKY